MKTKKLNQIKAMNMKSGKSRSGRAFVFGSQVPVADESGRGLPHSKTLSRQPSANGDAGVPKNNSD
jgi:hypothetical protein